MHHLVTRSGKYREDVRTYTRHLDRWDICDCYIGTFRHIVYPGDMVLLSKEVPTDQRESSYSSAIYGIEYAYSPNG